MTGLRANGIANTETLFENLPARLWRIRSPSNRCRCRDADRDACRQSRLRAEQAGWIRTHRNRQSDLTWCLQRALRPHCCASVSWKPNPWARWRR